MKHYNIPIFIPEIACPHRCVFCNQQKISGYSSAPSLDEIETIISNHIKTIDVENSEVQIGFFGGSFTGINFELQESYLQIAHKYLKKFNLSGIRISTRPDYIDEEILRNLKKYGVNSIELGAQSLDEEILIKSGRGHSLQHIENAAELIKKYDFELGLQMMLGLPGDTLEKSIKTAKRIVELKADNTRIYPTLVIEDTALAKMYKNHSYMPLTLEEAVDWSKEVLKIFEKNNVKVLRTGLHPSEEFEDGKSLLAGPYHPAFKEMVLTELWGDELEKININQRCVEIFVNPKQVNYAIGFKKKNKVKLLKRFETIKFTPDARITDRDFNLGNCR
jgi:radical SAM enzyme (TIGR01210 family)